MVTKKLEFPCTKQCLVYASCKEICTPYRDYVQEAYKEKKYRCFRIVPPPPKQIQELSEIMNRIERHDYKVIYYTDVDMFVVFTKEPELLDGEHYSDRIIATLNDVRKRTDLKSHKDFPEELK